MGTFEDGFEVVAKYYTILLSYELVAGFGRCFGSALGSLQQHLLPSLSVSIEWCVVVEARCDRRTLDFMTELLVTQLDLVTPTRLGFTCHSL